VAYDFIMADPPWRFETYSEVGQEKSASQHYDTMTLDDIKALPIGDLARSDCLLWLWATGSMIDQQLEVMSAWRFQFVTMGTWVKQTVNGKLAFGTGYRLRDAAEFFLIGKRGDPVSTRSVRNVVMGPLREHSRKPNEAYAAAEQMMPNARRADVFARTKRSGWEAWGNEVGKFDEVTA
jgi:N6-adenosine-specific RNA methylase IME4